MESDRHATLAADNEKLAKAETERVHGMLYTANFGRIQDALRDQRIGRVRQLLRETMPKPGETDLRGFEWHFVDREVNGQSRDVAQLHIWGGGMEIHSTTPSLSRDGRWVAMVDALPRSAYDPRLERARNDPFASLVSDHELNLWDLTTGQKVFALRRAIPENYMAHQAIVSTGHIAWASGRTVTIYDPATKAEVDSITLEGHITNLRFDAAGKRVAALTWKYDLKHAPKELSTQGKVSQVEVWDVGRKERLHLICARAGGVRRSLP